MNTQGIINNLVGLVFILISMTLSTYYVVKFVKEITCKKEFKRYLLSFYVFLWILALVIIIGGLKRHGIIS